MARGELEFAVICLPRSGRATPRRILAAPGMGLAVLGAVAGAASLTGCRPSSPPPSTTAVTEAASTENADAGARSSEVSSYDLEADVRARVDAAKGLWGPDTRV